jgi:hypothetical protein
MRKQLLSNENDATKCEQVAMCKYELKVNDDGNWLLKLDFWTLSGMMDKVQKSSFNNGYV